MSKETSDSGKQPWRLYDCTLDGAIHYRPPQIKREGLLRQWQAYCTNCMTKPGDIPSRVRLNIVTNPDQAQGERDGEIVLECKQFQCMGNAHSTSK